MSSSGKKTPRTRLLRENQRTMTENGIQPEQFEDRIIFVQPMSNDIDWTKKSETKKFVFRVEKVWRTQEVFPKGTLVVLRTNNRRRVVRNAHLQAQRFVEQVRGDDAYSQSKLTSYISINKCVRPTIFENHRRRNSFDSVRKRFDDSRVVVSHNYFRQFVQCLRSNIGLVRRTCAADLRSFVSQNGETRGEHE